MHTGIFWKTANMPTAPCFCCRFMPERPPLNHSCRESFRVTGYYRKSMLSMRSDSARAGDFLSTGRQGRPQVPERRMAVNACSAIASMVVLTGLSSSFILFSGIHRQHPRTKYSASPAGDNSCQSRITVKGFDMPACIQSPAISSPFISPLNSAPRASFSVRRLFKKVTSETGKSVAP